MAKAVFEGFILSVNKTEGAQLGAIVQVDFVLMVRSCTMELHRRKADKSYWEPLRFSCPARAPYKLQNAFIRLEVSNYVTVTVEKDKQEWRVTDIRFTADEAKDFRALLALNEEIL
ncbi:MAG: hypothetical protein IJ824_01525 [Alphaproteobacteria bacterium]|nr:hypothetical protein [Alphaproteobacteria bacterium]